MFINTIRKSNTDYCKLLLIAWPKRTFNIANEPRLKNDIRLRDSSTSE